MDIIFEIAQSDEDTYEPMANTHGGRVLYFTLPQKIILQAPLNKADDWNILLVLGPGKNLPPFWSGHSVAEHCYRSLSTIIESSGLDGGILGTRFEVALQDANSLIFRGNLSEALLMLQGNYIRNKGIYEKIITSLKSVRREKTEEELKELAELLARPPSFHC